MSFVHNDAASLFRTCQTADKFSCHFLVLVLLLYPFLQALIQGKSALLKTIIAPSVQYCTGYKGKVHIFSMFKNKNVRSCENVHFRV